MLHQTGRVPRPVLPRPGQSRCVAACAATVESAPKQSDSAASQSNGSSAASGPTFINGQILHSIEPARLDVINSLEREGWVEDKLVPMLRPVEKSWQPADYLPDGADPDFLDKVAELRSEAEKLPDDYLVVLVGDMVTEEGLPTYMTMLNTLDGVRDETGASGSPWARWTRAWTAEENRHGDLLNKYLYLTGKVNMRAIETTVQNLIGCGMNPKTENNPYLGFVYTSFQERATSVSHGHTARQAGALGNKGLEKICAMIAADEARHEVAYIKIVSELFKRDPDGAMLAFADMMRKQVIMPAHMMTDFEHEDKNGGRNLFADFSEVAQKLEVYTAFDYAAIMEHLIKRWKIAEREGLSGEAAKEQEYLVGLPGRVRKLSERMYARRRKAAVNEGKFSWIYDRPVALG